jgi:hypothetical protein
MKKLLILSIVTSLTLVSCSTTQKARIGVKAGANFSTINGDETDNLKTLTAFHVGAVAEVPVSDNFSVQPELLYSSQGAKYEESEGYDGKFKFDYINVPIMAKFNVSNGLSLEAGPQVGFLMSAKDEYSSTGDSGSDDIKDDIKGLDFGLNIGAGLKLDSGINFGARYSLGLSNVNDFEGAGDFKNQNGVIQLYVGYFFN